MPPLDMSQMLGVIAQLGQLQLQKREQSLREQQYQTGIQQFAQSFGLTQKDQQYRQITTLLDKSLSSAKDARDGYTKIAQVLDLPQEAVDAMAQISHASPQTQDMLRTLAANRGQMPGANALDREAYTGVTTGMNQGQAAASGVTSQAFGGGQVAPGTFAPNFVSQLQQGLGIRSATGQDPMAFGVGQTILANPGMLRAMSRITAGTDVSEKDRRDLQLGLQQILATMRGQDVNAQVGMYGHNVSAMLGAGQLGVSEFAARAGNAIKPSDKEAALAEMRKINEGSSGLKTAQQESVATALWNAHVTTAFPEAAIPARLGGLLLESADDFKKPGLIDRATALVNHSMATQPLSQPQPPSPFQPAPVNPGFTPSPSMGGIGGAYPGGQGMMPPPPQPSSQTQFPPFNIGQYLQMMPQFQPPPGLPR